MGRYTDALETRRDLHEDAASRGHDMAWRRNTVEGKPTNAFHGECKHCGATASVGPSWSSTDHPNRDARSFVCSGPGTKWQSDMQRELASARFRGVADKFLQDIKDVHDREWLRGQGIEASRKMTREAVLLDVKADSNKRGRPVIYQGRPMSVPLAPPRLVKSAHVSGNQVDVFHCFAGDERFLTPEGPKSFAETVGTVQRVLTSDRGGHEGYWVEAPIRHFGEQEIWELTLQRNKQRKVIRTTAGHRWLVGRPGNYRMVTTENLIQGHRLAHLRTLIQDVEPSRDGIRQGVMFGDGSVARRDYGQGTYGAITLWAEKAKDLGEFFDEIAPSYPAERENGLVGLRYTSGMAGWTKELPPLGAGPEFLRGWLMGYIATDGSVDRSGKVSLASSVIENLEHVRNVATLLGIGTYGVTTKLRQGYGDEPTPLYTLAFASGDLDTSWLLRQRHRDAFSAVKHRSDRFGWTVATVEQTDEIADVYCATVPGTESFALEDNIHTANCPFCGSGDVVARSDMSIGCGFCNSAFTVTVSPQYPAFPMSVGGQPYPWPGRPDGGLDPAMMGDPNAAGDGGGFGGQLIPGGGGAGDEGDDGDGDGDDAPPWADGGDKGASSDGGDDEDTEAEVGGSKKPPFGKKKSSIAIGPHSQARGPGRVAVGTGTVPSGVVVPLYRTVTGARLPEVEFMRHLAIATAHDPNAMAQRVKQERRG